MSRIIEEVADISDSELLQPDLVLLWKFLVLPNLGIGTVVQVNILILIFGLGSCSWYQTSFEMEWKSHAKLGQETRGMCM